MVPGWARPSSTFRVAEDLLLTDGICLPGLMAKRSAGTSTATSTMDANSSRSGRISKAMGPASLMTPREDAAGRRRSAENAAGTVQFDFDAVGRMVRKTHPNGHRLAYSYDLAGR